MKRYRYHSKGGHLEIQLDVYSPRELVNKVKSNLKRQHGKRRKLFAFKIEKKGR